VFPGRYELDFYIPEDGTGHQSAVKTSDLTCRYWYKLFGAFDTMKPRLMVFVGGLEKERCLWENDRCDTIAIDAISYHKN
jgi:hypothetical protein